jgi:hypothetical protein
LHCFHPPSMLLLIIACVLAGCADSSIFMRAKRRQRIYKTVIFRVPFLLQYFQVLDFIQKGLHKHVNLRRKKRSIYERLKEKKM